MSKKNITFASRIGLKNNQPYPCLMTTDEKGHVVPFEPKYGVRKLPVIYKSREKFSLGDGKSFEEIYCYMLMRNFRQVNLIPTDINPRNGIYDSRRRPIVDVAELNPHRLQYSFGISVIAKSAKYDRHVMTFEIPKSTVVSQKKYGVVNGQNLTDIITSIVEAVLQGKIEYDYDMDEIKIPITFVVFSDNVSMDEISAYCEAKNFTIAQTTTALATMRGDFDKFIYSALRKGIEIKFGEAKTDIEYREMLANVDKMKIVEDNLERFTGSRVNLTDFFKYQAIIHYTVIGNLKYRNEMAHLSDDKQNKSFYTKEEISEKRERIRTDFAKPVMAVSKHKNMGVKEVLRGVYNGTSSALNDVQNEELMEDFFVNAYDYVRTFDFTEYFKKHPGYMELMGFAKMTEKTLSPFKRNECHYKISVAIMNFVAFMYGCLCEYTEDAVTKEGKVVSYVNFEDFWNNNYEQILDKVAEFRKSNSNLDTYCYTNNALKSAVNLWNYIRKFCEDNYKTYLIERKVA